MIHSINNIKTHLRQLNPRILYALLCVVLGVVASFLIVELPPFLIIAAVGGIFLVAVSIFKPAIGVLALIAMISSIIFEDALPMIRVPGGSLHATDVLLLILLCIIPLKIASDKNYTFVKTPLDKPLLLFCLMALISAWVALVYFKVDFNAVMRRFRHITYYLTFFLVTNLVREKKEIKFVIKGLFAIATIVGMAMIVQAVVGESFQLMPGRVEAAETFGKFYGATRILPPGQTRLYER